MVPMGGSNRGSRAADLDLLLAWEFACYIYTLSQLLFLELGLAGVAYVSQLSGSFFTLHLFLFVVVLISLSTISVMIQPYQPCCPTQKDPCKRVWASSHQYLAAWGSSCPASPGLLDWTVTPYSVHSLLESYNFEQPVTPAWISYLTLPMNH